MPKYYKIAKQGAIYGQGNKDMRFEDALYRILCRAPACAVPTQYYLLWLLKLYKATHI